MKKYLIILVLLPIFALLYFNGYLYSPKYTAQKMQYSPKEHQLSLLFIGDIMGHTGQIRAAYDDKNKSYHYDSTFNKVAPLIKTYDYAVANLEVTLAGKNYKGYPRFSSPDALVVAAKKAGINMLVTANNHACDTGRNGIQRTLKVLDSLKISHTGTFAKLSDRNKSNLFVLNKNSIRVGILNYTEHTNCLPTPFGTFVNRIDMPRILKDINESKALKLDKLIVFLHWGPEYLHQAKQKEIDIASEIFKGGADIVIGGHPHVIQPMKYSKETNTTKEELIYYSLGNFVSDQRRRYTNGGVMAGMVLSKISGKTTIKKRGYHLIWVNKHRVNKKKVFEVLPVKMYESNTSLVPKYLQPKIKEFIKDSRSLLKKYNKEVLEW